MTPGNDQHPCQSYHHSLLITTYSTNDMPEKVHGIELYSCDEYQTMRRHWNGCGLILHELCHLLHQLVLRNGLDNGPVKEVYDLAIHSRKYEQVSRRDWANLPCDTDQAYATINHKEFLPNFLSPSLGLRTPPWMGKKDNYIL